MIGIHESMIGEYVAKGYRVVSHDPPRAWVAHPKDTCLHKLTTGLCQMDAGHRGRHATKVFWCDGCGHSRRGSPISYRDPDVDICFMCSRGIMLPRVRRG